MLENLALKESEEIVHVIFKVGILQRHSMIVM